MRENRGQVIVMEVTTGTLRSQWAMSGDLALLNIVSGDGYGGTTLAITPDGVPTLSMIDASHSTYAVMADSPAAGGQFQIKPVSCPGSSN